MGTFAAVANVTLAPFVAVCAVLVAAGIAKLRDPRATAGAARAIGLPGGGAVRLLGGVEVAAATAALVVGGAACLAVAALFGFLAFVALRLRRRAPATPCGCLGASAAPASLAHVGLNVVATILALIAVTQPAALSRIAAAPLAGAVFVVLALCCARLAVLAVELQEVSL
jgi:hypothetical protein